MFRILLLILLISSFVFAQTSDLPVYHPLPEATKLYEFERATDGEVNLRINAFFDELNKDQSASAYIITFGTPKDVAAREKQIRVAISYRKYDISRITFINGGYRKVVKTELWIVPAGANLPSLSDKEKPQNILDAYRFEKLGIHSDRFYLWVFGTFFAELKKHENLNAYILVNANDEEFTAFEQKIRKLGQFEEFIKNNSQRIFFVKGKPQNTLTSELWFVPKGAKFPKIAPPKAKKFDEFGVLSNTEWRRRMKIIAEKINEIKNESSQLFIINYGTKKEIAVAEQLIHRFLYENCQACFGYSNFKITYLRGKSSVKARRTFWIVPEGAEKPIP